MSYAFPHLFQPRQPSDPPRLRIFVPSRNGVRRWSDAEVVLAFRAEELFQVANESRYLSWGQVALIVCGFDLAEEWMLGAKTHLAVARYCRYIAEVRPVGYTTIFPYRKKEKR
jgi:hypothetical protein